MPPLFILLSIEAFWSILNEFNRCITLNKTDKTLFTRRFLFSFRYWIITCSLAKTPTFYCTLTKHLMEGNWIITCSLAKTPTFYCSLTKHLMESNWIIPCSLAKTPTFYCTLTIHLLEDGNKFTEQFVFLKLREAMELVHVQGHFVTTEHFNKESTDIIYIYTSLYVFSPRPPLSSII